MERADKSVELPESPQHRVWRHAQALAAERIDGLWEQVRGVLEDAPGVLNAGGVRSDGWFALAERLQTACWQLGSVTYCLSEWAEPDDASPDVDDRKEPGDEQIDPDELGAVRYRRGGRRNVWSGPPPDPGVAVRRSASV